MDRRDIDVNLSDPLLRYGLADLIAEGYDLDDVFADASDRIERLVSTIRVQVPTSDYEEGETGQAHPVPNPTSESKVEVAERGYYVRTHVLQEPGRLPGLLSSLPLKAKKQKLRQKHYPHVARLSVGKSQAQNERVSATTCALSLVAALTPNKAARVVGKDNRAALFPDLPLEDLVGYIQVFKAMKPAGPGLEWRANSYAPRLRERDGNFPKAPPAWAFSNLGLCAAIGVWAEEASYDIRTSGLIEKLANAKTYVLGAKGVQPETYYEAPHIAPIATEIYKLIKGAWKPVADKHENQQELFYDGLKKWLLYFDDPSWRGFLRVRAQYPPEFTSIIDHYLMQYYPAELVESAKTVGRHINTQCYFAADGDDQEARRENKAKLISSFESLVQDGKSPASMISRVSAQVGRLTDRDFPSDSEVFFDSVMRGEIGLDDAKNMLMAYMRLKSPRRPNGSSTSEASESSEVALPE
jgi:hypothetical protein